MYDEAIATGVPAVMLENAPVFPPPAVTSVNDVTLLALPRWLVLNVAVPEMLSIPEICVACACWQANPVAPIAATIANMVFDNFICFPFYL